MNNLRFYGRPFVVFTTETLETIGPLCVRAVFRHVHHPKAGSFRQLQPLLLYTDPAEPDTYPPHWASYKAGKADLLWGILFTEIPITIPFGIVRLLEEYSTTIFAGERHCHAVLQHLQRRKGSPCSDTS